MIKFGDDGALIKSFTTHSQSYIYDQALAIIAFTKNKNQTEARKLLQGLKALQMKNGSLYFSYNLDGSSIYPAAGDKRIAGAMAWVALAAVQYQTTFNSKEFLPFNLKLLTYLKSEIVPVNLNGKKHKALRFAPRDVASTKFDESDTVALEHNLDAYSAFAHFVRVNNVAKWSDEVKDLKKFILAMWNKADSHFWSGAIISTGRMNKSELYLDTQTWSLLALDEKSLRKLNPKEALKFNCEEFRVSHNNIEGFLDSKPSRRPASVEFVWSEGTLGQILAMKKMEKLDGKKLSCGDLSSEMLLSSIQKMKQNDGGIAYATSGENPDFTTASSVAGTAWLYFAEKGLNPFEIN